MKKIYLLSSLLILTMVLFGCSTTSDNGGSASEVTSNTEKQTEKQTNGKGTATEGLPSKKEQPTTEGEITEKEKVETNQTESDSRYTETILYENTEFGFTFSLPKSWEDYKIVTSSWEGTTTDKQKSGIVEIGPVLSIRHPQWTEEKPRQDIPIMIFTLAQWSSLENGDFHIGAAPIGPTKLGKNNKYVFAIPARYNYAYPDGFREVEDILKNEPLQPKND